MMATETLILELENKDGVFYNADGSVFAYECANCEMPAIYPVIYVYQAFYTIDDDADDDADVTQDVLQFDSDDANAATLAHAHRKQAIHCHECVAGIVRTAADGPNAAVISQMQVVVTAGFLSDAIYGALPAIKVEREDETQAPTTRAERRRQERKRRGR